MGTVSSGSAHKMGVIALTLVTASNMMGSGVFMLPINLAGVEYISLWGWLFTIIGVIALALVFAKTSLITPRTGGIVAYASDAFGPFIGFQTTLCYWISAWVGNVALLVAGVGYLSYFFPELRNPVYGFMVAIVILWAFIVLASFGANVAGRAQSFTASCMLVVVLGIGLVGWFWFDPHLYTQVYNGTGRSDGSAIVSAASIALWGGSAWSPRWCPPGRWIIRKEPCRVLPLKDFIAVDARRRFERLCEALRQVGLPFTRDPHLYPTNDYDRLLFEWHSDRLVDNSLLCRGGRYDECVSRLLGKPGYACGFAFMVEPGVKLLSVVEPVSVHSRHVDAVIIPVQTRTHARALSLGRLLRNPFPQLSLLNDYSSQALAVRQKNALRQGARFILWVEAEGATIRLLDQENQDEKQLSFNEVVVRLSSMLIRT